MTFYITGSKGRMGQSLVKILSEANLPVVELNKSVSLESVGIKNPGTVIDFSAPDYFDLVLAWATKNKLNFVSGTTGLSECQFSDLKKTSLNIPVLWAPNMSIGVAFVNKLLKHYQTLAQDFDFQIEESHHKHKKDKPSGTAILLQNSLAQAVQKDLPEVLAIRGGGIFGNHKILAMSEDETILLEHNALNRDVFSRGAIRCAHWLADKPAGVYTIDMVLEA